MATLEIKATIRENVGNQLNTLRRQGNIPGVIYSKGQENIPVILSEKDIKTLERGHILESLVVNLKLDLQGKIQTKMAIISEVQKNHFKDSILHIDFHEVSATEKIISDVTIESVGEAKGVKDKGGLLEHQSRTVELKGIPTAIPEVLHIDISNLDLGDNFQASDIQLPDGVELASPDDLVIFSVVAPSVNEEKEATDEEAANEPEVITKKKEETEE